MKDLYEIARRIIRGEDPDTVMADIRARDAEREAERARAEGRLQ